MTTPIPHEYPGIDGPNTEFELLKKPKKPTEPDWSDGPLMRRIAQVMGPGIGEISSADTFWRRTKRGILLERRWNSIESKDLQTFEFTCTASASGGPDSRRRVLCWLPGNEEITARNIVRAQGAVAVSLDCRHVPEYKFPYAVEDAWAGLKRAAANATSFGADPSAGFLLGGTSAGANIATVLIHRARDEGMQPSMIGRYSASLPAIAANRKFRYDEVEGFGELLVTAKIQDGDESQNIEFDHEVSMSFATIIWVVWTLARAKVAKLWS